jgi:hypothetical protein
MPTYELTYEAPLGSGKIKGFDLQATSIEEARQLSRIVNPTLRIEEVERNPIARYLKSGDGQQFVALLRKFEHTLYAKVRDTDKFFKRYYAATGVHLSQTTPGILISEQENKWGDELLMTFALGGFEPTFPTDAHPRMYDGGKGVLNDNEYIWYLIEQHGFRFGKVSQASV